uniref:Uncharacterized protein n=1 Tax=Choristoneura fumiferana granulovirus TaxID=56947 RepID=Q8V9Y0_GVCF|nr:unknown [Choristoneura fumiferana granulovirus]
MSCITQRTTVSCMKRIKMLTGRHTTVADVTVFMNMKSVKSLRQITQ